MTVFSDPATGTALCEALQAVEARVAFGLPGTQNFSWFDALRRSPIRTIVPSHELAASFMAGAYGRVSGRPGILMTIPGPGFAFALPGLAEARLDSAPIVFVVLAPPTGPHQRFLHQALDQAAIAGPLVKACIQVARPDDVGAAIRRAHHLSLADEPGPVMVQLGVTGPVQPRTSADSSSLHGSGRTAAREIWARLRSAQRPVLFLGQGCAGAAPAIEALVRSSRIPVFTTVSGRGVLPENSPYCLSFDTLRQSAAILNSFLATADLVVAVGARLAHNGTAGFGIKIPRERLAHVDTSPDSLNAMYPADLVAQCSAEEFFALADPQTATQSAWDVDELREWRDRVKAPRPRDPEPLVIGDKAPAFFERLRAALPDDAILTTDTGMHQILTRRYFEVRSPNGLLIPTDLQSMGFGMPAAIAAKLACPDRPVVALIGDGGAFMSGLELATAVRERIAVTVIVFNDGFLNQIRIRQIRDNGVGAGVDLPHFDFAALAATTGATYYRAGADVGALLTTLVKGPGVNIVDVPVGDSPAIRASEYLARTKSAARFLLGKRMTDFAKRILRRAPR